MIAPNDPAILYSPYNWDRTFQRAKTINAGAYFRVLLTGSPASVVLLFDLAGLAAPLPKVTWEIDGWDRGTVDVAARISIPLPAANTWGQHLLTVTVEATSETTARWKLQETAVKFTGIETAALAAVPAARPRRALVLGDSITEGVRTLNRDAATDTARNSSRLTWSHQLGPLLDAEIGVVGFGATGITRGGSGAAPALAGFWNTQWEGGPSRGLLASPPDYIIINMGTNDGASVDIVPGYTAVLDAMLATATTARIICLVPFGGKHRDAIRSAAAAARSPSRCLYVDTSGWWDPVDASDALHPYGYVSPQLARRTADAILADSAGPPPAASTAFYFDLALSPVPLRN